MEVRNLDRAKVEAERIARSSTQRTRQDAAEHSDETVRTEPHRRSDNVDRKQHEEEILAKRQSNNDESARTESAKEVEREQVDISENAKHAEVESNVNMEPTGTYNEYTVNSDNEVVVTIRNSETGSEVKQIPSEEQVAAKQAFRQMVDKIFDTKI